MNLLYSCQLYCMNEMGVIELLVIMFQWKKVERIFNFRNRWYRYNIIRETRLKSWSFTFVFKRFISLQYHFIIPLKGMNFSSNQIDQIPILFHHYLLWNPSLWYVLFYSSITLSRELKDHFYIMNTYHFSRYLLLLYLF